MRAPNHARTGTHTLITLGLQSQYAPVSSFGKCQGKETGPGSVGVTKTPLLMPALSNRFDSMDSISAGKGG